MRSSPGAVPRLVKTHGSDEHCVKPYSMSHGKRVRCQRRPACAMPYTGFSTLQMRGRPSAPSVA
eukprot:5419607-Pleurochrysis_carterae.AAC.1